MLAAAFRSLGVVVAAVAAAEAAGAPVAGPAEAVAAPAAAALPADLAALLGASAAFAELATCLPRKLTGESRDDRVQQGRPGHLHVLRMLSAPARRHGADGFPVFQSFEKMLAHEPGANVPAPIFRAGAVE